MLSPSANQRAEGSYLYTKSRLPPPPRLIRGLLALYLTFALVSRSTDKVTVITPHAHPLLHNLVDLNCHLIAIAKLYIRHSTDVEKFPFAGFQGLQK
ncbi:hypothetical protein J6590_036903 [Homalodisca vitripennis]|nr:hypothetical protein J6590_036903 [Homalodisca vitripennis]